MPRNFGVRAREFWNGETQEHHADPTWPIYLILAAVAVVCFVGIFA